MTFKEETRLTPALLLPVMVASFLGNNIFQAAEIAAPIMEANAYLAVILGMAGTIPVIYTLFKLQQRYPGETVIEFAPRLIGKIPARLVNLSLLIYIFLYAVLTARDAVTLISTYLLERTPLWAIMALGLVGVIYLAYHGMESIARFSSFIFIPATGILILLFLLGFINADFRQVRPFFGPRISLLFVGGFQMISIFIPLLYLLFLQAFLKKDLNKSGCKITCWAVGIVSLIIFIEVFGMIATFGPHTLSRFTWPVMDYVHNITLPYLIIEEPNLILLLAWFTLIFAAFSLSYWVVALGLSRIFSKTNYKLMSLILAPVTAGLILLPQNFKQFHEWIKIWQQTGIYFLLGYPVILWLMAVIFRKRNYVNDPR